MKAETRASYHERILRALVYIQAHLDEALSLETLGFRAQGEVGVQTIAGGDYAIATHEGAYERLGETYARLCGEWLPRSGREPRAAPTFEHMHNTPLDTAPAGLRTDIYLPLAS